jgi:hypothetical protein
LSATAQNSSDAASQVINGIEFLSETFGKSGSVLSKEGNFLQGVDDTIAASYLIGASLFMAQSYSFQMQATGDYSIIDSHTQDEYVSVIMQPYKADVISAYYIGIYSTFTGFPGFSQWLSGWTAPTGVSKIMNYYPYSENLCWYEQAFNGSLSFYSSSQFPCPQIENQPILNSVSASFNCGNGPVPMGPCPGNNSQNNSNSGNGSVNSIIPGVQKWPTVTGPTAVLPPTLPSGPNSP